MICGALRPDTEAVRHLTGSAKLKSVAAIADASAAQACDMLCM